MAEADQLAGKVFGRWTILKRVSNNQLGDSMWECLCLCGVRKIVKGAHVKRGFSKSCGCYGSEMARARFTKHGMHKSREFGVWGVMIQRCGNKRNPGYKDYGARGIKVCKRWKNFVNFFADMGPCPLGLTLERINNNAGYSPSNCCWADRFAQNSNTRRSRLITLAGRTQNVYRWSQELGVSSTGLYKYAKRGELQRYEKLAAAL